MNARAFALLFVVVHGALAQQQAKPPIRSVSAPTASTTEPLKQIGDATSLELPGGKLLVNAAIDRLLLLYDVSLARATALADTMNGAAQAYSFAPRLVSYLGDSAMLLDVQSRSLVLITPSGEWGRVMAPPIPTFNGFGPGGGVDSKGRIVFAQFSATLGAAAPCTPGAAPAVTAQTLADSGYIVRASFETRSLDTIARNRGAIPGVPVIVRDASCHITSVKWPINPMLPSVDTWTMTSKGVLAIVRGADYHVDFVYADGRKVSGAKMPFDWRRLTDENKQATVDSARRVVDSVAVAGGYRARVCGGMSVAGMSLLPPPPTGAAGGVGGGDGGGGGRGGGGGGVRTGGGGEDAPAPTDCKWIPMTTVFPALQDMPDYIPPIRQTVPKADVEGNVWILPTTSLAAKDGLLYDVVNTRGELVERVQLPANRDIIAFGRNGILYLSRRDGPNRVFIERVKIAR